jgi:deoxyribodipyrimidine photo-lyase
VAERPFPGTRAESLARLEAFLPRAGRAYAARRNLDEGPGLRTHVSGLSPAIRRRLVTEEEVARAATAVHGLAGAGKFIEEVCWRSFWRGHLEQRPALWRRHLAQVEADQARLAREPGLADAHAQALAARTGIDCFDAWVGELAETGYLHNHARMSFASIWIFTLRLPWALGAAHFFRHLLDGCPASNTLSWRWVAGLQTVGKTYLANPETIRRVSLGRFRVGAPLARAASPLPAEPPAPLVPLPRLAPPDPALPAGLWITTEDLSPETMANLPPVAAVAAADSIGGDPAGLKRAYAEAGLEDACRRAAAHFAAPVARLPEAHLVDALVDWAERHRLRQVVTPYAPVGPVADRVDRAAQALARAGVALLRVMRGWDRAVWPHATRGFFAFRPCIAEQLA